MTLEQAIKTLTIAEGQQMSGRVEEAIRIVLDNMKKRVEVVRCEKCSYSHECEQMIYMGTDDEDNELYRFVRFCSYGERR